MPALRVAIVYHSSTGNNLYAVQRLKQVLEAAVGDPGITVTRYDVARENKLRLAAAGREGAYNFPKADFYILGSWACAWMPPPFMREYLEAFPAEIVAGKRCAAFCIHGGNEGKTTRWMLNCMAAKGAVPVTRMESCFVSNFPATPGYPSKGPISLKIKQENVDKVNAWCDAMPDIVLGKVTPPAISIEYRLGECIMAGVMGPMANAKFLRWYAFRGPPEINSDKCTRCGTCVAVCPVGCWDTETPPTTAPDGTRARVVLSHGENCIGCVSCLQNCPAQAIHGKKGRLAEMSQYKFSLKCIIPSPKREDRSE